MQNISVIGLGKLGVCTAACLAYKGFNVLGVDINQDIVKNINSGFSCIHEPKLQEIIKKSKKNLIATTEYDDVINHTDLTIVIVPTPTQDNGNFSNKYLIDVFTILGDKFKKSNKNYHLFVCTSTVSPETCDQILIPHIEKISEKQLSLDFGFCYNPEFIALGSVIHDTLNPDMVLIGGSDKKGGDILQTVYERMCDNKPYIARMSIISAEIAKISLNAYITMKISFANTLGNICENVSGSEIDKITSAIGADKRISPYYLKAGLGFGGPCFPRDNKAFAAFSKKFGVNADLAVSTDNINFKQNQILINHVMNSIQNDSCEVAILGMSYKQKTPVIEESPGLILLNHLIKRSIPVSIYDPLAMDNVKSVFKDQIKYSHSVEKCIQSANVCIIALPYDEFKILEVIELKDQFTIIDCWRLLNPEKINNNINYIQIGRCLKK